MPGASEGGFGYSCFALIDAVIQFTLMDIERVYRMEAAEFFAYVEYIRAREKRKADEIRKIQMR